MYHEYMKWFFHHGMLSVYPNQDNEEILSQAVPEQGGHVADIGYVPDAMIQARLVNILIFLFNILFYFILSHKLSFKYIIFL